MLGKQFALLKWWTDKGRYKSRVREPGVKGYSWYVEKTEHKKNTGETEKKNAPMCSPFNDPARWIYLIWDEADGKVYYTHLDLKHMALVDADQGWRPFRKGCPLLSFDDKGMEAWFHYLLRAIQEVGCKRWQSV